MKNKLHVLFLCSWYPSRILPSNGDFIQRHAEAIALKHKVTVVHVKTDPDLNQKIEITDKTINNIRTLIAYIKPSKNTFLKWIHFNKAYQKLINKVNEFDIVHVNKFYPGGYIAHKIKKQKKIPYIITEHHTLYHKPYCTKIDFFEKMISKIIVKNANYICPVSNDLAKAIQNFGLKGNFYKIPNVVDIERFKAKKENPKIFTILHVSSMAEVKNIDGILNVVKKLEDKITDFKFNLIGANAEDFKTKATDLNINLKNINFKNQVSHQEIAAYFQQANVFILFSEVENLPCVILESFSCGTPVISTDVGGISEYFPNDFGILIKPKNEKQLLNAILKIKKDFRVATPKKMNEYVKTHFSKAQICKEFTNLYIKAINEQK